MKKNSLITLAIALPAAVSAVELTDYSDPVSQYEDAYIEGRFNTQSGNQDQTSYDANVNANWESVSSSLPRTTRLQANARSDFSRAGEEGAKQRDNTSATVAGNIDNYFKNDNRWFWFGSGELGYLSEAEDELVKLGAGIGYGRVIDATPLAKVLRIEEELREHGIIVRQLTTEQYLRLARLIDREEEFESEHGADEYKPHFFAAIEAELITAGVLSGDALGGMGSFYIDRVLYDEPIGVRKHGWSVRAGTGVVLQDYQGEADNDPSLDAAFEYSMPYGFKGQFQELLSYSSIFGDDTNQLVSNRMSYSYEVSDRIDWINLWALDYFKSGNDDVNDITTNALSSSFRYYLTNQVTAGFTVSATQVEDDIDGNDNDDTDLATFFDIRYRVK